MAWGALGLDEAGRILENPHTYWVPKPATANNHAESLGCKPSITLGTEPLQGKALLIVKAAARTRLV